MANNTELNLGKKFFLYGICPYMAIFAVGVFSEFSVVFQVLLGMVFSLHLVAISLFSLIYFGGKWVAGAFVTTVDKPNHYLFMPLFAKVENGRAKSVVDQGGNNVRCIVNMKDAGFAKQSQTEDGEWEIVKHDDKNIGFSNARNVWEKKIEEATGLVFVGIFPWRRVYHYKIVPSKISPDPITKKRTLMVGALEPTDHVRVREFDWGAEVTVVLKDLFKVTIYLSFRLRCTNPKKLLFNVDRWEQSFANAVDSRITELVQNKKLDQFLTLDKAKGKAKGKSWIAAAIMDISDDVAPMTNPTWGLKIIEAQVSSYEFLGSEPELASLTIVEVTRRLMKARALEYKTEEVGESGVVDSRAEVIARRGRSGEIASRDQMLETAAKDGQQTMITGLGTSYSPESEDTKILKGILAELTKKQGKKED